MKKISLIVCCDESGGFGKDGKIPWNRPDDLAHFQKVTKNSICIMGRKTYEDIKQMKEDRGDDSTELLPGRECYVLSRTLTELPDAKVTKNIRSVIASTTKDIFVIGGLKVFVAGLSYAQRIHMTIIPGDHECDRFFPIDVVNRWFEIESGEEKDDLKFMVYKRKGLR